MEIGVVVVMMMVWWHFCQEQSCVIFLNHPFLNSNAPFVES
jgi:hypothetical protein